MSSMKKYTGDRRRTNPVKLSSDKMLLASIGVIIACIFLIRSMSYSWSGKEEKSVTLAYSDYYQPSDENSNQDVLKLVEALNKMNNLTCPTTRLRTARGIITVGRGTVNPDDGHAKFFFITDSYVDVERGLSDHQTSSNWVFDDWDSRPITSDGTSSKGWSSSDKDVKLWQLFEMRDDTDADFTTIVAPFNFKFLNANTDGKKIVIVSTNTTGNKFRITFDNVLAWFCATPEEGEITHSILEAHTAHGTPLGLGEQSYVQAGVAGQIIGFSDEDTTVHVEVMTSTGWETTCVAALYGRVEIPGDTH